MNLKVSDAKREDGFTLIELLVVVIIIGILAAIAIPLFLNQRERAWIGSAESDTRNTAIDVETLNTRDGSYPAYAAVSTAATTSSDGVSVHYTLVGTQAFQLCAQHLNANGSVVYDSALGGLQPWDDTVGGCSANTGYSGDGDADDTVAGTYDADGGTR